MNLADGASLLVVFTGIIGGAGASASTGAPWWITAAAGVLGAIAGVLIAWPVSKAAYKLLGMNSEIGLAGYMVLPFIAIIGAAAIVVAGTIAALGWMGYGG